MTFVDQLSYEHLEHHEVTWTRKWNEDKNFVAINESKDEQKQRQYFLLKLLYSNDKTIQIEKIINLQSFEPFYSTVPVEN